MKWFFFIIDNRARKKLLLSCVSNANKLRFLFSYFNPPPHDPSLSLAWFFLWHALVLVNSCYCCSWCNWSRMKIDEIHWDFMHMRGWLWRWWKKSLLSLRSKISIELRCHEKFLIWKPKIWKDISRIRRYAWSEKSNETYQLILMREEVKLNYFTLPSTKLLIAININCCVGVANIIPRWNHAH